MYICPFIDTQYGKTPLTIAAERGKTDVVKELVRRGADVNAQDKVSCLRGCSRHRKKKKGGGVVELEMCLRRIEEGIERHHICTYTRSDNGKFPSRQFMYMCALPCWHTCVIMLLSAFHLV